MIRRLLARVFGPRVIWVIQAHNGDVNSVVFDAQEAHRRADRIAASRVSIWERKPDSFVNTVPARPWPVQR